jgi:hypothetical protein
MAKTKSSPKAKAKGKKVVEPERSRQANLHIRATQEWTDWVKEGAEHCRLSVSSVIDVALTRYFKDEGFAKKPPRR